MPILTGAVSFSNVNTELRRTFTAQINMADSQLRSLADMPSTGAISMFNLRGKSK